MDATDKSELARKAGSVRSEKKRQKSAGNLQIARKRKQKIWALGVQTEKLISELGVDTYNKAIEIGTSAVRQSLSATAPQ